MNASEIVNVAAHLPALAERQPHTLAVVFPDGGDWAGRVRYIHRTYQQLNADSDQIAHGLQSIGLTRGVRTVLMVRPSLEFFALTFALFKVGAVPILVDPGMGVKNLGQCLTEARPEAFIGITKAQLARVLLRWARSTIRTVVTVGHQLAWGGVTLGELQRAGRGSGVYPLAPTTAEDVAAILFTSGSTGPPKGAVYTHGIFAAQVELLRQTYAIRPGEIDLATFPLFALFAPALGMTAIIPDMDPTRPAQVDPRKIIQAIEDWGVTNLFGSPALLNRVGEYASATNVRLPSLRRVISAGAPVSAAILERFSTMLSHGVQIHTPYGATEALPVCSIGSTEILTHTRARTDAGEGVCVGHPIAGMEVKIIRISDKPIAAWSDDLLLSTGEIGEIVVRGPVVTRAYDHRPEATALAKIPQAQDGAFYHRMGDVGYLDNTGRLWFCGRKSHRVITTNGDLYTIPCEAVFNTHPQVRRTALVGVGPPGQARPVLCVECADNGREMPWKKLEVELLALGASRSHTQAIQTVLCYPRSFPVDIRHNAKIFREKLAEWAARRLS
jgi:acyl-CoA synthetase (AMP-forming)/AMP-acid ligase II